MNNNQYDVVVMGGGIAGLMLCRHLKLKEGTKHLRIANIDPQGVPREDQKIGEALIEWSSCFLERELKLREYLFENKYPIKQAISFHYIRRPKGTVLTEENTPKTLAEEYYCKYPDKGGYLRAWFVDRAKLETDLVMMNTELGVDYYHGRAHNVKLNNEQVCGKDSEYKHTVDVKMSATPDAGSPKEKITLQAKYLVDAAGRCFLIGSQIGNVIRHIPNVESSSSWFRVSGFDRKMAEEMGWVSNCPKTGKQLINYYSTNHLCYHGCYTWQIPLDQDVNFWSIGVTYFHDAWPDMVLNTREKLLEFFKNHYPLLYKIIESGHIHDFMFRANLAYRSKQFYFEDQYAVLGDAAAFLDPFASPGIAMNSLQCSQIADIIEDTLGPKQEATKDSKQAIALQRKIRVYNRFFDRTYETLLSWFENFGRCLGHTEAMSLTVSIGSEIFFSTNLPIFLSKKHLDVDFSEWYVDKYVDHAIKIYRHIGEGLRKIRTIPLYSQYPVNWEFCFWDLVLYHSTYAKKLELPEENEYPDPSEVQVEKCLDMALTVRPIALGQIETMANGFMTAALEPLVTSKFRYLNWTETYYYWMGCLTKANIFTYAILSLLPVIGQQTTMDQNNIELLKRVMPNYAYRFYSKVIPKWGLAPSMLMTRPSTKEAFTNLALRSLREVAFMVILFAVLFLFLSFVF